MRILDLWHIFKTNKENQLEASPRGVITTTILHHIATSQGDKIDPVRLSDDVCLQLFVYLKLNKCLISYDSEKDNFKLGMGLKAIPINELSGNKSCDCKNDTH